MWNSWNVWNVWNVVSAQHSIPHIPTLVQIMVILYMDLPGVIVHGAISLGRSPMGRSPWDDRPWGGSSTMRAETAPKGAAIVWCELNTNIEGFFQEFFLKKTFIYFIWLRQTILFTLGEGWE